MADTNDYCIWVNSDFKRVPNTPMEGGDTDVEDLLDEGQKTPKGFPAWVESSIDPVVAALTKKVNMLVVQMDGLSNKNSELRVLVDGLGKENSGLLAKVDGLMAHQEAMEREMQTLRELLPSAELLAECMHKKEHETAKFVPVDNTRDAMWDTSTSKLNVQMLTAKYENGGGLFKSRSIRSTQGFSTLPMPGYSDSLIYAVNYFEVAINQTCDSRYIHIGMAEEKHPMNNYYGVGSTCRTFGIAIDGNGTLFLSKWEKPGFGSAGFTKSDFVGCGLMVTQKTRNANAAKCEQCLQKQCMVFFTKNGQLLGTPIPLPSDVPSMLYPTVSLQHPGDEVSANFGQQQFKYEIPPAKGLNVCGHCCHCKKFA